MAEYSHLSIVDPEFAEAIAKLPALNLLGTDIATAREASRSRVPLIQAALRDTLPPESEYKITDRQIDVEDGVQTLARCIVPTLKTGEDGKFPVLFWFHGGGWAFGDVHGDDYTLRRLAVDYRLAVINYEYRLAPEHPFPTAPDDCFKAFKYFAANPDLLSADFSKGLIVGGSSAGANLAAVLVHLVRDDPHLKDTPITGQLLVIPALVHPKAYPEKFKSSLLSMEQNKDAPILPKAMIETFYNWYKAVPTDPKTSPLLYPSHEGLPPAYFQICGLDPLRDEGLLYEKILKQVGVRTKLEVYPGVPHGFLSVARDITLGKKYLNDFRLGVEWLLREGLSKQSFLAARG